MGGYAMKGSFLLLLAVIGISSASINGNYFSEITKRDPELATDVEHQEQLTDEFDVLVLLPNRGFVVSIGESDQENILDVVSVPYNTLLGTETLAEIENLEELKDEISVLLKLNIDRYFYIETDALMPYYEKYANGEPLEQLTVLTDIYNLAKTDLTMNECVTILFSLVEKNIVIEDFIGEYKLYEGETVVVPQ